MKLKKILAAVAAAAVAVSTMAVSAFAADVWSGSNDLGTDWDGGKAVKVDAAQFADVKSGDTVEISYVTGDGADYSNIKISTNSDGWPTLVSPTGMDAQWGTILVDKGSTSYSFTINDADVASVQATGMVVAGYNVTITKVAVSGDATDSAAETTEASTGALSTKDYIKDGCLYINADKASDPHWAADAGVDCTAIYGVVFYTKLSDDFSGAIALNSNSTGWSQNDFNSAGTDAIVIDAENGTVTFKQETPFFKADDKYAQILLKAWSGTAEITAVDILDKDGNRLNGDATVAAKPEAAPAAEEKTAEAAPEAEDEDVDVDVEPEEEEEETAAEPVEEPAPAVEEAPAPAVENATAAPATGNTAVASIVAVMAVAGAAALVAKKRK